MSRWQNVMWNIPTNPTGGVDKVWVEIAIAMDIRDALLAIGQDLHALRQQLDAPPPRPVFPPLPDAPPREEYTGVYATPINELALSVRSYHVLDFADIKTVGDLVQMTRRDLLRCPNFGKVSLREVEQLLDQMGLKLKPGDAP